MWVCSVGSAALLDSFFSPFLKKRKLTQSISDLILFAVVQILCALDTYPFLASEKLSLKNSHNRLGFLQLFLKNALEELFEHFQGLLWPVMDETISQSTISSNCVTGSFGRVSTWVTLQHIFFWYFLIHVKTKFF